MAPVAGIIVFFTAYSAHDEGCHGGMFPVIRQDLDEGIPRATLCAGNKGIMITVIAGLV
jgi:hypothetical protein